MADNVESVNAISLAKFTSGLAQAVNKTYTYASGGSLYSAFVPTYMRDYAYRYIMPACQWLDGYVPYWHDGVSGIVSTRLASALIGGITKQVIGEKLLFSSSEEIKGDVKKTLAFVSKWAQENKIKKAVYAFCGFGLGVGTSLIKMNKTIGQEIWWEAVRMDNAFYLTDFKNEVQEATFLIRGYTDSREGKNTQQYFLTEHRFYKVYDKPEIDSKTYNVIHKKNDKVPMVEYKVYRTKGTTLTNTMATASQGTSVNWDEIPYEVRKMIKDNYSTLRVDEPQELGFLNLGVEIFNHGEMDISVPTANFGTSLLILIQSEMITYEFAYSCRLRDMYLGKGTVYQPKNLNMGDLSGTQLEVANGGILMSHNELSSMPTSPVELMTGVDPETQKIIVSQFELRADEWQKALDDSLKAIATKIGMSPKIIASYLSQGSAQQTATQIDSDDDQSIAFINTIRAELDEPLNRLLETTLNFYGKPANVSIGHSAPSLINKDRLLTRCTTLLDAGLIDLDEAIRIINPDLDEETLQAKIEKIKPIFESKKQEKNSNLDPFGDLLKDDNTFNNLTDQNNGENLNGSGSTQNKPNE